MKRKIWTFVCFWSMAMSAGADTLVTCVLPGVCVLPCTSSYHNIIHWHKDDKIVHSFYSNADQLTLQDAEFKDRTSLFLDQIPKGNISLMLKKIWLKDKGRYKCYAATEKDSNEQFVSLNVRVDVKDVDLKTTNDGISCSVKDVYAKPKISWTKDGTSVEANANPSEGNDGLFSLSSVLLQTDTENTTYICSISFEGDGQVYYTSLRKERAEIRSGQNATIHCPVSKENTGNNITLRFGTYSINMSYSQTSQQSKYEWKGKTLHLAHNGTLTIHKLESSEHTGTYRCEGSTAQSRQVVETSLKVTSVDNHMAATVGIACGVIVGVIIIGGAIWYVIRRRKKGRQNSTDDPKEEVPLESKNKSVITNHESTPIVS